MYRTKGVHPFPLCFEKCFFFQTEEGLYSFIFKKKRKRRHNSSRRWFALFSFPAPSTSHRQQNNRLVKNIPCARELKKKKAANSKHLYGVFPDWINIAGNSEWNRYLATFFRQGIVVYSQSSRRIPVPLSSKLCISSLMSLMFQWLKKK